MISYRTAANADYSAINAFHNKLHNDDRSMEQFEWEFCQGPYGKAEFILAFASNDLVGTQCYIPIELVNASGDKLLTAKSEATLVDPSQRGKGLFSGLYDEMFKACQQQGIEHIWGFTYAIKPFARIGFDIPFQLGQSMYVSHIGKSYRYLAALNKANKWLDRLKIWGLCLYVKTKQKEKVAPPKGIVVKQEMATDFKGLLKKLLGAPGSPKWYFNLTKEYMDWRVYNNPNYKQVLTFCIYKNNELLGHVCVNLIKEKSVAYIIHSLLVPKLLAADKEKILAYISKLVSDNGIGLIRNWTFSNTQYGQAEKKWFEKAGYFSLDRGTSFVWKDLGSSERISPGDFLLSRMASQGTT